MNPDITVLLKTGNRGNNILMIKRNAAGQNPACFFFIAAVDDAYIKHDDMQARADRIESTNGFHHFKATGKAHIVKGAK